MVKKKNKRLLDNIWKRLHFKYRLSATNENTLEEIWKIRTSIFSGVLLFLGFAFILITVTSMIIIATPIRYYLPGYLDAEVREGALRSAIRIDSIENQIKYQEAYIQNLKQVFAGELQIDSVKIADTVRIAENDPRLAKSATEALFTKEYEERERYNLSTLQASTSSPIDGIVFFSPIKGLVSEQFNPTRGEYGITISTPEKETVMAALEGTIIFSGYDFNDKFIIQIQHRNGFISIYKHNTAIIKAVGDKVKTGEAIAYIGTASKEDKTEKAFLKFELWYKGNAVNPEEYITFWKTINHRKSLLR